MDSREFASKSICRIGGWGFAVKSSPGDPLRSYLPINPLINLRANVQVRGMIVPS